MTITLRPEQQQLIADALRTGAFKSPDEVIERALQIFQSQEEWLLENRQAIDAKIRRGIEQLDRGEGVPEDELDAHLARLKTQRE